MVGGWVFSSVSCNDMCQCGPHGDWSVTDGLTSGMHSGALAILAMFVVLWSSIIMCIKPDGPVANEFRVSIVLVCWWIQL